jgi:hypothetical protein
VPSHVVRADRKEERRADAAPGEHAEQLGNPVPRAAVRIDVDAKTDQGGRKAHSRSDPTVATASRSTRSLRKKSSVSSTEVWRPTVGSQSR